MNEPTDKKLKKDANSPKQDTVTETDKINKKYVEEDRSANVSAVDIKSDTTLITEIKQPKQVRVTDHDTGKVSVINNYDTLSEVSLEEYEPDVGDVFVDDVTDKFSEASIRIEERFECGLCASPSVIGRCDQCIEYLCQKCLNKHDRTIASGSHHVFLLHCEESMKINKVVPAVGFCHMCQVYLCEKCVVNHKGFKKFRDHIVVRGAEMPIVRPIQTPVKPKKAPKRSNLLRGEKSRSVTRLSDFSSINPMYQREPKLMWSERKGYFFKWFQY